MKSVLPCYKNDNPLFFIIVNKFLAGLKNRRKVESGEKRNIEIEVASEMKGTEHDNEQERFVS